MHQIHSNMCKLTTTYEFTVSWTVVLHHRT